jgi:hypothetical protein
MTTTALNLLLRILEEKHAWCSQCVSRRPRRLPRDRLANPRRTAYVPPTSGHSSYSKIPCHLSALAACSCYAHEVVRALEPAIRDVFLQAVQNDGSYMFLNAVQGLAALADSFGTDVLRALVRPARLCGWVAGCRCWCPYKQDVDVRLRIGEALRQVIRRCGDTFTSARM